MVCANGSAFSYLRFIPSRDRPAAIPVHVKHMADTSNFDDFEELNEQKKSEGGKEGGGGDEGGEGRRGG